MILAWFNGREAAEVGAALADEFVPRSKSSDSLQLLLQRADAAVRPLQLNFYKKAKFANSFKWRLIEKGISSDIANGVTQSLIVHLSQAPDPAAVEAAQEPPAGPQDEAKAHQLFHRGNKLMAQGAHAEAAALYEEAVQLDPTIAEIFNNLGSALDQLGRAMEAEQCFRHAMMLKPNFPDAYANLGILLRLKSDLVGAEASLRHALKLKPTHVEARVNLGLTLTYLGRLRDARACFAKVLKAAPRNVHALQGMGNIAVLEGRFEEAESTFRRIIALDPRMPNAWAALASTRKMTVADAEWFKGAEEIASSAIHPLAEANLRFAMGKYCDDVADFPLAFQNFKRGNELLKAAAEDYDRRGRSRRIDELIRLYSPKAISNLGDPVSRSEKPVFVVGMPRSGTSLAEQIIASHPAACGAGELPYWERKAAEVTEDTLSHAARSKLAEEYLGILEERSASASRVIDKAPVNSDFLGLIYSVFPNARVIYMQRDPIDTCLSCYFQQFFTGLNFTFDLSDLAHYFREHKRIMAHWRAVLPPGFILEVPYEALVSDQEIWSRRMVEFIGLDWDARCLEFHANKRHVITASAWQVRQKIYRHSVARWRNYAAFIGPLKSLADEFGH